MRGAVSVWRQKQAKCRLKTAAAFQTASNTSAAKMLYNSAFFSTACAFQTASHTHPHSL
ncbi:hypothetical protein [Kingella potus]|uniref:hypothetical protein n=1 Tax=Kingella potus TaxID=265175 RepID=UPI001FCFDF2C|nr:hypothetical protein [Kingella potus]UOP00399.1 hypothetical protein LVJ84_11025 [Kingella potus]